ncbi:rRNA pseudouridine synthase [Candidatus Saccharibacteria bacterium]|nr:rRNA pseudouridine synthase [Candidatus Saccharibacteria bacterium]
MRLNKYIALATGLSRRAADLTIKNKQIFINDNLADTGQSVSLNDVVKLNNIVIKPSVFQTILLNKPTGYVVSRNGQGSKTIYDLLPQKFHALKPIGRLDKDSSGLLILTNDGNLANKLTHPSNQKSKVYKISLDKSLQDKHRRQINRGIELSDGISTMNIRGQNKEWTVTMSEGRNRQIRRTFKSIGYNVLKLHRIQFGEYQLNNIASGEHIDTKYKT